jgi:preprotein translocase subunit SecD
MIKDARQVFDQADAPVVAITLTDEGARRLARVTSENVGKPLAFLVDGVVLSAPMITEPITAGMAQISGDFSVEIANRLAILIESGDLPIKLAVVEEKAPPRAHRN